MAMEISADCIRDGSGPTVVLVHSSISGARQWLKLMEVLAPHFTVVAPNLYGYGDTPAWPGDRAQSLADHARLVEGVIPQGADRISLVGHSMGGSVVLKVAERLGDRVEKLVLLEPNPFFLLRDNNRPDAFAELMRLCNCVRWSAEHDAWHVAAQEFCDYWGGAGSWDASSEKRRAAFAEAIKPNLFEWDAVLGERTPLREIVSHAPDNTMVVFDPNTVGPIREIVALLRDVSPWLFVELGAGGHMAPLTHPELVNSIVEDFLLG